MQCGFCKRGEGSFLELLNADGYARCTSSSTPRFLDQLLNTKTELLGPYPFLTRRPTQYVHHCCAMWAPQVHENYNGLPDIKDVKKELLRGRQLKCFHCKKTGAVIGCQVGVCKRGYHLPCSVEANCAIQDWHVYCPNHVNAANKDKSTLHQLEAKLPMPLLAEDNPKNAKKRKKIADEEEDDGVDQEPAPLNWEPETDDSFYMERAKELRSRIENSYFLSIGPTGEREIIDGIVLFAAEYPHYRAYAVDCKLNVTLR